MVREHEWAFTRVITKCTKKTEWRRINYRDIGVVQIRDGGGMDQHDCVKIEKIRIECILGNLIDEYECIHKKFFLKEAVSIITL